MVAAVRELKSQAGPDMVILGSGSIVSQLTAARLIDEYQLALNPIALGGGRTLFEGVESEVDLTLKTLRPFGNGNVVLWYERG
jgi:dihydrofolate reductase